MNLIWRASLLALVEMLLALPDERSLVSNLTNSINHNLDEIKFYIIGKMKNVECVSQRSNEFQRSKEENLNKKRGKPAAMKSSCLKFSSLNFGPYLTSASSVEPGFGT